VYAVDKELEREGGKTCQRAALLGGYGAVQRG